jgi:NADP-dependent 3-hydroxy acid dehydrogenase YdfG
MFAKALALNGAKKVYITGRRTEVLEKAAKESPHGNIIPLPGDVSSKESLLEIAEHVRKEDGYLNLLIANAGAGGPGPHQVGSASRTVALRQSLILSKSRYRMASVKTRSLP